MRKPSGVVRGAFVFLPMLAGSGLAVAMMRESGHATGGGAMVALSFFLFAAAIVRRFRRAPTAIGTPVVLGIVEILFAFMIAAIAYG